MVRIFVEESSEVVLVVYFYSTHPNKIRMGIFALAYLETRLRSYKMSVMSQHYVMFCKLFLEL